MLFLYNILLLILFNAAHMIPVVAIVIVDDALLAVIVRWSIIQVIAIFYDKQSIVDL